MSFHARLSPEAEAKIQEQRRNSTILSIIISLLGIALLGLILYAISIAIESKNNEEIVSYVGNSENPEDVQKPELTSEVKQNPSSPSANLSRVIATATPSAVSIPNPEIVVEDVAITMGDGNDFGSGWGSGGDGDGGGGGGFSAFGRANAGGLVGRYYDLKQDNKKKLNRHGKYFDTHPDVPERLRYLQPTIKSLQRSKFSSGSLARYYKAETKLSFTHLVIQPDTSADLAPKSFGVEKEVAPSGWVVVYEGEITPEKNGQYKFHGYFDDVLLIYINGKLVLDGSFSDYSGKHSRYDRKPGALMRKDLPIISSDWVNIRARTKIKIVVGESPGGHMGGGIFIQEKGKKYKQAEGGDILPPFTTSPLRDEDVERLKNIKKMYLPGNFPMELDEVPVFRTN